MNTHDLVAFVAVVETGSVVAASARLNLTQPGVTRRIQNLEEMLGAQLLDRLSKPLKPTAANVLDRALPDGSGPGGFEPVSSRPYVPTLWAGRFEA